MVTRSRDLTRTKNALAAQKKREHQAVRRYRWANLEKSRRDSVISILRADAEELSQSDHEDDHALAEAYRRAADALDL